MDLLGALGVLVRVVETGSFSAVARERELSQAAVGPLSALLRQRQATSSGTANHPVLPSSQTTPALCTMSDRIRTCGNLLRPRDPRIFECPADFSPTTCVRCTLPLVQGTGSPISSWSKSSMTSAMARWFAY